MSEEVNETQETATTEQPVEETATAVEKTSEPAAEAKPSETPEPKKTTNLLDDDEPEAAPEKKDDEAKAPDEEALKKYCEGIPALDLGDGVKWDDATLQAMAPSLMELTGGDPKKADGVVKAYAKIKQDEMNARVEASDAFNDGLIKECEKRFGPDLGKIRKLAKTGGRQFFGDTLWNEMKQVREFANNPDILERLAAFGKTVTGDTGHVKPKDDTSGGNTGDVLHRMYGNIKV